MSESKKFLYINRKAPYGTIYAWESLEVVLIGAAFEQDVSLAFLDDGVYQLVKGQDTTGIGMKGSRRLLTPTAPEPGPPPPCGVENVLCRFIWMTSKSMSPGRTLPSIAFKLAPS